MKFRPGLGLAVLTLATLGGCFEDPNNVGGTDDDATSEGDGDGDPSTGDGDPSTGDGDPSTGDGDPSGDGDPTTTTGAAECDADDLCVADTLVGWEGPLAVYVGPADAPPPTCLGDTPVKVAELFGNFQVPEAPDTCQCQCGDLTGATCGSAVLEQQSSCAFGATAITSWNLAPGQCQAFGGLQASARYEALAPDLVAGSCPASVAADIVEAGFVDRVVACSVADDVGTCDGGVCLAPPEAPFDGRVCIATQGDVQCPSGPYSQRSVYHMGADDQRSCADCSCTVPDNTKCGGGVQITGNANCLTLLGTVAVGSCSAAIGSAAGARYSANTDGIECEASVGAIEGEAAPTGAWTFCCQ